MRIRYAIGAVALAYDGSDPNGIRTRVTAVKGRCPRPLDDRVGERQISSPRQALQAAFVAVNPITTALHRGWLEESFSMNTAVRAAASLCG